MATNRVRRALLIGALAALSLTGCTGVGVDSAPDDGSASYQVWGLNETSSDLSGDQLSVVLNGDLDRDSKPFFTAHGTWRDGRFELDDESADRVRELAGRLPERTGDPQCSRLVLVQDGVFSDQAVAVVIPDRVASAGPVTATPLKE